VTAARSVLMRLKLSYVLGAALLPLGVFALVFGGLCAYECTAAPWVSFLVAPVLAIAAGVALLLVYWRRAGRLSGTEPAALRRFLLWSLLWGPVAAIATFYGAVWLLSALSMSAVR
jgi:hypothetical protein